MLTRKTINQLKTIEDAIILNNELMAVLDTKLDKILKHNLSLEKGIRNLLLEQPEEKE